MSRTYVVVVGEPNAFFESSSELPTSFACRNGKPRLNRLAADDDVLLLLLGVGVVVLAAVVSRGASFDVRFPYLFFRYRAQELNAAPSLSSPADAAADDRSGDDSRAFNACDERLRAKSLPPVPNDVEAPPYLLYRDKNGKSELDAFDWCVQWICLFFVLCFEFLITNKMPHDAKPNHKNTKNKRQICFYYSILN